MTTPPEPVSRKTFLVTEEWRMQHRTMRSRWSRRSFPLAAVCIAACIGTACSDSNSTAPLVATAIDVGTGSNAQTGVVGQALATPVTVVIVDQNGAPIANAVVGWTVVGAGGTVSVPTTQTDATGSTSVTWTLGTVAGVDSLTVLLQGGTSTTVTATAAAAGLTSITIVSGDAQSVSAGSTTAPLIVKAADQFGNRVPNANITWMVTGGGSLSSLSSVTDTNGQAQVTLTTDPSPATYAVTATAGGTAIASFTVNGT
jgi:adhesin/invasin